MIPVEKLTEHARQALGRPLAGQARERLLERGSSAMHEHVGGWARDLERFGKLLAV